MAKEVKIIDNEAYRERFQFILKIGDYIICQRYFKCRDFNPDSVHSFELKEVLDSLVNMIQEDLVIKSRIYDWYTTDGPIKLKGFVNDTEGLTRSDVGVLINPEYDGENVLSDGRVIKKEYVSYTQEAIDAANKGFDREDSEEPMVFDFSLLVDDKIVYERIWDGSVYPKYVRNGVDLYNSDTLYAGKEPSSLHFGLAIARRLNYERPNLVAELMKSICDVLSYDSKDYTMSDDWGGKKYTYSTYDKDYVDGYKEFLGEKYRLQSAAFSKEERGETVRGIPVKLLEEIDSKW